MSYARHVRTAGLTALAALILSACASAGGGYAPPPPPPPPDGSGPVLRDWRTIITSYDRDRYGRVDAAWRLALEQARRQEGSGNLGSLGALLDPDAGVGGVTPPEGDYRCRTVKLGSQGGEGGLGYVVYGWFDCRIERTPAGLKFSKLTGSQRPSGLLFPENDREMVMLGSMALGSEPPANSYGQNSDRDMVAVLERIGSRRWRLVIPWPQYESNLDLIELVPN
ncbi:MULTISPECIES: DUF4893 domain-containing protein [unclassified Brevundimonas]|jgi:hypothetical protein|uniref:DUF4893 domain-containing protein n=1 Tax=unclassified Brevundimonas TaxID=2622653 RepID=UPI000C533014|nr:MULTISPECIES: DUF4893 domain-containing protein [unclassified Brevundimonas]MAL88169.1 DUF4893 domain-containing protein [Brevundimonas sp.]|tara:strand:+ start:11921 stop:12592 length:672 start_codon:yes stop_codon:yes gene_type:complete